MQPRLRSLSDTVILPEAVQGVPTTHASWLPCRVLDYRHNQVQVAWVLQVAGTIMCNVKNGIEVSRIHSILNTVSIS